MGSRSSSLLAAAALSVAALSGCDSQPEPVPPPPAVATPTADPVYDGSQQPAAAVLALVPAESTALLVSDFATIRLELGYSELTSESPRAKRARFWRKAERQAPLLVTGRLRPDEQQLETDFGFTGDDVQWEALFDTPSGAGWVLRLRDDLDLDGVQRAIDAGVPSLAGGVIDAERHLVTQGAAASPEASWAAVPERAALVGGPASATYLGTDCLPFDVAFGSDVENDLAPAPADAMESLDQLADFSVSFGSTLGTVRLGAPRSDTFDRARLADLLPATDPEFGLGFASPVADPSGGRIGYRVDDASVAARLVLDQRLPFAVCAG
ncbi:hypothetical protein BH11ACT8_BH11ACT8_12620 [soil metagenome]